jgi:glycosyltransferase A (GT-A) superfamily protein (DUF2064 family)
MPARPRLYVMVKEPRPGRVKTRLGREIGAVPAAWWARHQAAALLRRLAPDPRWRTWLAVAPDGALGSAAWPARLPRRAQGGGDLGARMARLLRGPGPVVVVGADMPGLRPAHIARAIRLLGRNDAVFGPADDGGYWLIGLANRRAAPAGFLKGVRWSGPHALADSIATLPGRRVALADRLADIDTAADLAAARVAAGSRARSGGEAATP